jgi:RNA recognition motif-containing protein
MQEREMNKKLFVGGLPYAVTDDRLEEVFAAHGSVESARVVTDKFTGQSRGFGFVEMSSPAEASAAVTALNETDLDGRTITVAEARPREDRSRW